VNTAWAVRHALARRKSRVLSTSVLYYQSFAPRELLLLAPSVAPLDDVSRARRQDVNFALRDDNVDGRTMSTYQRYDGYCDGRSPSAQCWCAVDEDEDPAVALWADSSLGRKWEAARRVLPLKLSQKNFGRNSFWYAPPRSSIRACFTDCMMNACERQASLYDDD